MNWQAYRVVLRLCTSMHIGQAKIGNVQRTRPYVTGRVLWGALTLRLTRDHFQDQGPAACFDQYDQVGRQVHSHLAFTYFYPTTQAGGSVDLWPWKDDETGFRARYLSTYASTALSYPQQSADEGTLHEVEFISPRTLDVGDPVYLAGYVFAREGVPCWQGALGRLQLGGERGYGWGQVEPVQDPVPWDGQALFGWYKVEADEWPPVLWAEQVAPLLAHALAADFEEHRAVSGIEGQVEPLVGREINPKDDRFGMWLSPARVCYVPGSKVEAGVRLRIGPHGVWEAA